MQRCFTLILTRTELPMNFNRLTNVHDLENGEKLEKSAILLRDHRWNDTEVNEVNDQDLLYSS